MGHRMSSLPIAQYCAQGPVLGGIGAMRAAAISSAFHAKCAGDSKWEAMYARLDDQEQKDFDKMQPPTVLRFGDTVLDYADAVKEHPCGLDKHLCFVPHSHPTAVTSGTTDGYWAPVFMKTSEGATLRVLVVMDIKRSEWTSNSESLQLHAYSQAIAAELAMKGEPVDGYIPAIWAAIEGAWDVGEYVDLASDRAEAIGQRILSAAQHNAADYSMGRHCTSCYGRSLCPAYLVPPQHASAELAEYMIGELDSDKTLQLLTFVERVEQTCEVARKSIRAYVEKHGEIRDGESVYRAVDCKGRSSFDSKTFEKDHPKLVQAYTKPGVPYKQVRWTGKKRAT